MFKDLAQFGGPNLLTERQRVYDSNHILEVGVESFNSTKDKCVLKAFCLQTTHPLDSPHGICINTSPNFNEWNFLCSCKAGKGGKCKHIFATLLHILLLVFFYEK